jgi:hypothetical protein
MNSPYICKAVSIMSFPASARARLSERFQARQHPKSTISDSSESEHDNKPRGSPATQRAHVPGKNELSGAARLQTATTAEGKRGRPIFGDDSDDQDRVRATKRHPMFGNTISKQVIQNSASEASDDNRETMKATGEEKKAERSKEKSMRGIEQSEEENGAISPTQRADMRRTSSRNFLDAKTPSRGLVIAKIEETIRKELKALTEKEKSLEEMKGELSVRQESLEKRQADVGSRQEEVNRGQDDVCGRKGYVRGLESSLKKFRGDQLDIA